MSTLTENANRIKNATADIKAWMVAQGATPTGKIETFRTALDGIDIPKVASGTFTWDTVNTKTINIGFRPKFLYVSNQDSATAPYRQSIYRQDLGEKIIYSGTGAYLTVANLPFTATAGYLNSITDNGFVVNKANSTSRTYGYYYAIG